MATNGMYRPHQASSRALDRPKAAGPLMGVLVGLAIALFFAVHSMVTR